MNSYSLLILLGATSAKMSFGACPKPALQANFDSAAFAGNWYEILRDSSFMYEMGQQCSTQSFKLNADGNLDLYFRAKFMFEYNGVDGTLYCDEGSADTQTCWASMAGSEPTYPFNFLATDYDNYAVSYFCMEMLGGMGKMEWFNILSKSETLSDELLEEAKSKVTDVLPNYTITWMNTHVTKQGEKCDYDWTL